MWWLDLHLDSKEWLRENLRVEELPLQVLQHIAEAGGPHPDSVGVRGLIQAPGAQPSAGPSLPAMSVRICT